jgi:hypothetical protein
MTDRKKPGVAFWATVGLVVLLVGYPLSWGPVWWAHVRLGEPRWMDATIMRAYAPFLWIVRRGPTSVQDIAIRYRFWGMNLAEEQNRRGEQR